MRRGSILLLAGLDAAALDRRGVANQIEFTARAVGWIVAGHAIHHRGVLEERYLT